MTDNEKISGIPIEDDALENAVGDVTLPFTAEGIRNLKPVSPMDAIDKDILKVNPNQEGYEVDREHSGSDINPLTGEPLVKSLLR